MSFKEHARVLGEGSGAEGEASIALKAGDEDREVKRLSGASAASIKSGQSLGPASTAAGDEASDLYTPTSIFLQAASYLLDVHALKASLKILLSTFADMLFQCIYYRNVQSKHPPSV